MRIWNQILTTKSTKERKHTKVSNFFFKFSTYF